MERLVIESFNTATPTITELSYTTPAAAQSSSLYLPMILKVFREPDSYYVSPNGDDANPGTIAEPWRTVQHAVDSVNPGDTIHLRSGTYHESVQFHHSGELGNPIMLTIYMDETVTIDGGANPAIVDIDGTQYWIVEGLTLDSDAEHTFLLDAWGCDGTCRGSHHWIIRNNTIIGAVRIYGSYNLFESNEVDGSQHKGSENGVWEDHDVSHHNAFRDNHIHDFNIRGIWSMQRTHDDLFENNHIHHIGSGAEGMCIDTDGFGTVEWRHTIRGNHIHHCGLSGIELENTFDSLVENNIIHDIGQRGIGVINYGPNIGPPGKKCEAGGEDNQYGDTDGDNNCEGDITDNIIRQNLIYRGATNGAITITHAGGVSIWGNTISNTSSPGIMLHGGFTFCPEIEVRSNIIAAGGQVSISIDEVASLSKDDHNLLYRTGSEDVYEIRSITTDYKLSEYHAATGKGQGSIQANPQFVNPWSNDFHLQEISPAIDAGVYIGVTKDIDGNSRPQGSEYDIGAYESPAAPPNPGDFDGDRISDLGFFQASTPGLRGILKSGAAFDYNNAQWFSWGQDGDLPVLGDYDGDGKADPTIRRPPAGGQSAAILALLSSTGYDYGQVLTIPAGWPSLGDTPVPADYDGDGMTDPAIWRESLGVWIIPLSGGSYSTYIFASWGVSGDSPVGADVDGDGMADIGFYRASSGLWGFLKSSSGYSTGDPVWFSWGGPTETPMMEDYDGDGLADPAFVTPPAGGQTAAYRILLSNTGYDYGQSLTIPAGWPSIGDTPVPADVDGDGKADPGIWRESSGVWIIAKSSCSYSCYLFALWGQSGDVALPNRPWLDK